MSCIPTVDQSCRKVEPNVKASMRTEPKAKRGPRVVARGTGV